MVALSRNSLGSGRTKVTMPIMTGVQNSVKSATAFLAAIGQSLPASQRPGSVRTASANFVAIEKHSFAHSHHPKANGA
jgi:hypothetical protein